MENRAMERSWKLALAVELQSEEEFWRLKSRKVWRTTHDLNTKHFHLSMIIRRRCNTIKFIKNSEGSWISSRAEIGDHILHHFQVMFSSTVLLIPDDLDHLILPQISGKANDELCLIPTDLEILEDIRDIGSNKSLGPDGMTGFFKILLLNCWTRDARDGQNFLHPRFYIFKD